LSEVRGHAVPGQRVCPVMRSEDIKTKARAAAHRLHVNYDNENIPL